MRILLLVLLSITSSAHAAKATIVTQPDGTVTIVTEGVKKRDNDPGAFWGKDEDLTPGGLAMKREAERRNRSRCHERSDMRPRCKN
jgi:hypothetical protein